MVVPPPKTPEEKKMESALPSFTMPDVKTLEQPEKVESPALIEQAQADIKKKADFSADLAAAKAMIEKAEKASLDDVRRIADKYSISSGGLANLSQTLFGGAVRGWIDKGVLWYGRLKPLFERLGEKKGKVETVKPLRGKGVDVRSKNIGLCRIS